MIAGLELTALNSAAKAFKDKADCFSSELPLTSGCRELNLFFVGMLITTSSSSSDLLSCELGFGSLLILALKTSVTKDIRILICPSSLPICLN